MLTNHMFCSIIIPTVGRPSLEKSVSSILEQNFAQAAYEIIIVNDSGQPLAAAAWQNSAQVQTIYTQKQERCIARNAGAAIAKGQYLCFLDDDDWLLPNALAHLWALAQQHPNAAWLYGGVEFVDNNDKTLGYLNQAKSGNCFLELMTETWIPIQASLVKAELFLETGGFDPPFAGVEDLDLARRMALKHDFVNSNQRIAAIRRSPEKKDSPTRYSMAWYYIAYGRERLLAEKEALPRLLAGAGNSALLRGYVLRNYLMATLFNLRQRQWRRAFSRLLMGSLSLGKSLRFGLAGVYWQGVRQKRALHVDLVTNPSPDYESVEMWLFN